MLLFQNQPCCKQTMRIWYARNKYSYIHAKCERVLLDIYRDIHHFINVIYYSWVDDVKTHLICIFKKPKYLGNGTRYRETENAIESYLQMLFFYN